VPRCSGWLTGGVGTLDNFLAYGRRPMETGGGCQDSPASWAWEWEGGARHVWLGHVHPVGGAWGPETFNSIAVMAAHVGVARGVPRKGCSAPRCVASRRVASRLPVPGWGALVRSGRDTPPSERGMSLHPSPHLARLMLRVVHQSRLQAGGQGWGSVR
jgi:hypothetical protein